MKLIITWLQELLNVEFGFRHSTPIYRSYPKVYFGQGLDDGVDIKVVVIGDTAYCAGYDDSLAGVRYHKLCSHNLTVDAVRELGITPKFIEMINPRNDCIAVAIGRQY